MQAETQSDFQSICCVDPLVGGSASPPHVQPIYATSTFVYPPAEEAMEIFAELKERPHLYNRWGTPNTTLVERKIAALEGHRLSENGKPLQLEAVLFSSGMAAVSSLFLSLGLKPGDHVLTQGNIYGTTTEFLDAMLAPLDVRILYGELHDIEWVERQLRSRGPVRLIYLETPTNATARCYDIAQLAQIAHRYGAKCAVDSTLGTPFLQQPFAYGADFVVHSATKFLNGHSNSLTGVVVGRDADFVKNEVWKMRKLLGGCAGSFDAWLLNMGLKTLPLRMEKHCQNAMRIATALEEHSAIRRVSYLGLDAHPDHRIAARQMRAFGGVLSIEVAGGLEAAVRVLKNVRCCTVTATLGAMDTLIQHPATMTHVKVPREQRAAHGITDGLLRLSVGIEDPETIIADLRQALEAR
ncbi:Cystathionine gamma-lyase [Bradyrhizobium sp. ORS 375]|uniref:trans-sulfuration enzyme family protein n=1 Tax=Bradyrhizobium sp. (strain ORS 375) TaxID=566679 RepID=UPI0002406AA5|nr:PLP-dependent aspartate aminotransferase family protein [Bradyrhizobium sp. ORS 375]CCD96731.1 Cystathionine gamma-lyase [Bradyrhizobium sp. ORS 375]